MKKVLIFIIIFLLSHSICTATTGFPPLKKDKSEKALTLPDSILNYGMTFLNTPYHYGSPGPNTFDCSGFTSYIYKHFGYELPHSSRQQATQSKSINKNNLRKGDLVFFQGGRLNGNIGHVGIVLENNDGIFSFLHASIRGVMVSSSNEPYYAARFVKGGRIMNSKEQLLIDNELSKIQKTTSILPTNEENEFLVHTVDKGESLSKIAKMYDIPVATLKTMNSLKSNHIKKGMKLKVGEVVNNNVDNGDDAGDENAPAPILNNFQTMNQPVVATTATASTIKPSTKKEEFNTKNTVEKSMQGNAVNSPSVKSTSSKNADYYTVTGGETLYSIARKNDITVNKLKEINGLKSDKLVAGQKLKLSSENIITKTEDRKSNPSTSKLQHHTVKKGESLYSIHKQYNCSIDDLKKWNNISENSIKIGQKLIIYQ